MKWLIDNWRLLLVFLLVASIVLFASAADHYHDKMNTAQEEAKQAKQGQHRAEAITGNVITTVTLFNDIAKATHDDKQQSSAESKTRIVYIREPVKGDVCAAQPVPADAVNSLREHRDRIRSGASGTNPGRTAG